MRKRGLKAIPEFQSEAEERRFWETHDSAEFVDWSKAEFVRFPNLSHHQRLSPCAFQRRCWPTSRRWPISGMSRTSRF